MIELYYVFWDNKITDFTQFKCDSWHLFFLDPSKTAQAQEWSINELKAVPNTFKRYVCFGGQNSQNWFRSGTVEATMKNIMGCFKELGCEKGKDGINIDMEPYDHELGMRYFAALIKEGFKADEIVFCVNWLNSNFPNTPIGDWSNGPRIHHMTYYMAGLWDGWEPWHSSALSGHAPRHPTSISYNVDRFTAAGISKKRQSIGIALGAMTHEITARRTNVEIKQKDASDLIYRRTNRYVWDDIADMGMFHGNDLIVSVETEASLMEKINYANKNELSIMLWHPKLDYPDYFLTRYICDNYAINGSSEPQQGNFITCPKCGEKIKV